MAFPQRPSATAGTQTSDATTWAITVPAHDAGDLLVLFMGTDGAPAGVTPGTVNGIAWTAGVNAANGTACRLLTWHLRPTSNQATDLAINVTLSVAEQGAWRCVRITGAHATTAPEFATATGSGTTPNPPALNPANWDVEDTLWYAVTGCDDGRSTISAAPANYTNLFSDSSGGPSGAALGTASREFAAASDDPATFTNSRSVAWVAATYAVRPVAASAPTVNAGADVTDHPINTQFSRTATENDNGSAITSREWRVISGPAEVNNVIGTAAALAWTPTTAGSYTLRYSATNSVGTGTDDMTIGVTAPVGTVRASWVEWQFPEAAGGAQTFDEVLDVPTIAATITTVDAAVASHTLDTTIAATVEADDGSQYTDDATASIAATVQVVDDTAKTEAVTVEAAATFTADTAATGSDTLGTTAAATVTVDDDRAASEDLTTTIAATVDADDGSQFTDDVTVAVASTTQVADAVTTDQSEDVTVTAAATFTADVTSVTGDTLDVTAAATTTAVDALVLPETLDATIAATVTVDDQLVLAGVVGTVRASWVEWQFPEFVAATYNETVDITSTATVEVSDAVTTAGTEDLTVTAAATLTVDDDVTVTSGWGSTAWGAESWAGVAGQTFNEDVTVPIAATVQVADAVTSERSEDLTVTAAATTTAVETVDWVDDLDTTTTATITADAVADVDEDLTVTIAATIQVADDTSNVATEDVTVTAAATMTTDSVSTGSDLLDVVATTSLSAAVDQLMVEITDVLAAATFDLEGELGGQATWLETTRPNPWIATIRPHRWGDTTRPSPWANGTTRPSPWAKTTRPDPWVATARPHRWSVTVRPGRFVHTVAQREGEPVAFTSEFLQPYTQGEVPEPLMVRWFEDPRDPAANDRPMELHGQTPAWNALAFILAPDGTQLYPSGKACTILDPAQLTTDYPNDFTAAEDGWMRMPWSATDLDQLTTNTNDTSYTEGQDYQIQLRLENGVLRLMSTTYWVPKVRDAAAATTGAL